MARRARLKLPCTYGTFWMKPAAMARTKTIIALALLIAVSALSSGCITGDSGESTLPWSRQAEWENQIPGMGGNGQ
jgi:hypothetical protein